MFFSFTYAAGEMPVFSLKTFIKFERDVNPLAKQTSVTLRHLEVKSFLAYESLSDVRYSL